MPKNDYFIAREKLKFSSDSKLGYAVTSHLFRDLDAKDAEIISVSCDGEYAYASCRVPEQRRAGTK